MLPHTAARPLSSSSLYGSGAIAVLVLVVVLFLLWWSVFTRKTRLNGDARKRGGGKMAKEGFFATVPEYHTLATGKVGQDEALNASGQQLVRDKIDALNMSGNTCSHMGVDLPPEWRPTEKRRTCALDVTSHVVRNDCSKENLTLFPEDGVIEDAYVDPDTKRCYVRFDENSSAEQVRSYAQRVDIAYLLGLLDELRERVSELEQERERLANLKTQLLRQKRDNEQTIADLEEQVQSLEDRVQQLQDQIDELESERARLEKELTEARQNLLAAVGGTKLNFALDGKQWKLDGQNIRLKRGVPMCMTVKADDSRIYGSDEGMVAFFNEDDIEQTVRHRGFTMYAHRLNEVGPKYDFAYRIRYLKDGGVQLLNDYGGTSYVGYDETRDEVRIYTSDQQARTWDMVQCLERRVVRVGPPHPRALPGGWCCTHNGIRFEALKPLRLGRCTVEANRSGNITVHLSDDKNKLRGHVYTKTYDVRKGTQTLDLDMIVDKGVYFLWHDRNASATSDLQLYRSDSASGVQELLRDYQGIIRVLNMYNAALHRAWNKYWYSFHNIEVTESAGMPISNNGRCGPSHGTRCPASQCCSTRGHCGGGPSHCKTHVRPDTRYHGPDWKPVVLETGRFLLGGSIHNNVSQRVSFRNDYQNPVVVAYLATRRGGHPYEVRVRNVTPSSCEIFGQEPPNMDGWHTKEVVCYVVAEAGTFRLTKGGRFEAGAVDTSSVHRGGHGFGGPRIGFARPFSRRPAVLHSLNTYNNGKFLSSVASDVGGDGFRVQQEAAETRVRTTNETIGWIAFEPGSFNGYEVGSGRDGSPDGIHRGSPQDISFRNNYSNPPDVIVKGNSGDGTDGYWSRSADRDLRRDRHRTFAMEDTVSDSDRWHVDVTFGWAVFEPNSELASSGGARSGGGGGPLATVFKHCNFRGRSKDITREGRYNINWVNDAVGNDQMSSVRVRPGYEVELFQHANYRGRSIKARSDISCFVGKNNMNDVVSSLVVRRV